MVDRVLATREALRKAKAERRTRRQLRRALDQAQKMSEEASISLSSSQTSPSKSNEVTVHPHNDDALATITDTTQQLVEARAETQGALSEAKRCRLELEQSRHVAEKLGRELAKCKEKREMDLEACRRVALDETAALREAAERDLIQARQNFRDVADGWRLASDAVLAALRADHCRALNSAKETARLEAKQQFQTEFEVMKHDLQIAQAQCLQFSKERDAALEQLAKIQNERQRQMQRLKSDAARALADGRAVLREERKIAARDAALAAVKAAQELSKTESQLKIDSLQAELAATRADRDILEERLAQDVSQLTRRLEQMHKITNQQKAYLLDTYKARTAIDCAKAAEAAKHEAEQLFLEDATARAQAHADQINQLEINFASTLNELNTLKSSRAAHHDVAINNLRTELAARQEHIDSLQAEHAATLTSLRSELSTNQKYINALETEHCLTMKSLRNELTDSQKLIETLRTEHNATMMDLRSELNASQKEIEPLRNENSVIQNLLRQRAVYIKQLETIIQSRDEQDKQRQIEVFRAPSTSDCAVQVNESTIEEECVSKSVFCIDAKESQAELTRDIATREAHIEELSCALQQLRTESTVRERSLRDNVNKYANQVTDLKRKLQTAQNQDNDEIDELSLSLEAAADENKQLTLELSRAQEAVAAANAVATALVQNTHATIPCIKEKEEDSLTATRAEVAARLASTERNANSLRSRLTEAAKLAAQEVLEANDKRARQDAELVCSEIAVLQRAIDSSVTESTIVRTIVACL